MGAAGAMILLTNVSTWLQGMLPVQAALRNIIALAAPMVRQQSSLIIMPE